ncbi:MAG: hypothetical protein COU35_02340 [Candidatus Magasanikbacteria bacterium CG10_big_fil_rev_8_21_14_0_10_47_10]|uniref:Rod shape-determining protein MreD n=1 Tax=Candidatus Magasanikbacteria bacterium CG10_big_fil_rev_8_21_14_0_10_47_10 TaxID=1974652 RepID=A0A2H0TQS0_9BACT|nr:MAG: hypothetical protein COU35_02340 [Candidatus Magasanikbacteria bacterium CG10_big_fil_rev_8_21_14_0_10_47_10]
MHRVYRFFFGSLFLVAITVLHIGLSYLLPHPWNNMNILISTLMLFLVFTESPVVVWMTMAVFYVIELYAIIPFGIHIFSATMSTLLSLWAYRYVVTGRRWYSTLALTAFAILVYRITYTILLVATSQAAIPFSAYGDLSIQYAWEMLLTSLLTIFLYGIIHVPSLYRNHFWKKYAHR